MIYIKLRQPFDGNFPITQYFGENPQNYPATKGHNGVDYGLPMGTPIVAAHPGYITMQNYDRYGYGNQVRIKDFDSSNLTIYAHLSRFNLEIGNKVNTGDVIGFSGNSGRSTGPHLHFEYRPDGINAVNPLLHMSAVESPSTAEIPQKIPGYRRVLTNYLNLRSDAGTDASIVGHIIYGTNLYVTGMKEDRFARVWYKCGDYVYFAGWLTEPVV